MSLYNQIFGYHPLASTLMQMLKFHPQDVPRFRDAFVKDGCVCVYTRTGGGNREAYEEQNEKMRQHKWFSHDEDDAFDSTYALFYFKPDDAIMQTVLSAIEAREPYVPADRWKKFLDHLDSDKETDADEDLQQQVQRGEDVMKKIHEAIKSTLADAFGDGEFDVVMVEVGQPEMPETAQDSTGKQICVGSRVKFRGENFTVAGFGTCDPVYNTKTIRFVEEITHTDEVPCECTVDRIDN